MPAVACCCFKKWVELFPHCASCLDGPDGSREGHPGSAAGRFRPWQVAQCPALWGQGLVLNPSLNRGRGGVWHMVL